MLDSSFSWFRNSTRGLSHILYQIHKWVYVYIPIIYSNYFLQLYVCLSYRIGAPSTWSSWSAWSCTVCGSRSGVLNRHRTCTGTCTYTCAINSTSTALGANCSGGERVTSAGLWNLAIYFYFYALIEEVVGGKRGIIGLGEHGKERA